MPPARVQRELRQVAAVLAIRLLRLRAESDLTRRVTADRLREALQGEGVRGDWLPAAPWRVVALSRPSDSTDVASDLDVWETVFRRQRWQRPLVADDGGVAWALVTDGDDTGPGSWAWLRDLLAGEPDPSLSVRASEPVRRPADLPRARAGAAELAALALPGAVAGVEDCWVDLVLARAAAAVGDRRRPRSRPCASTTSARGRRTSPPSPRTSTTRPRRPGPRQPCTSTPTRCATGWPGSPSSSGTSAPTTHGPGWRCACSSSGSGRRTARRRRRGLRRGERVGV